ncbi:MAG: suppressor of fused domain protein, partial [Myxococcota bacterium]
PAPPPAPKLKPLTATALAAAAEALRQKLWGAQGQPLTTVEGVTIASALLPRGRPHWHLLTFGLGLSGFELSLRVVKLKDELAAPAWAVALLSALISRVKAGTLAGDTNQVVLLAEGVAPGTDSEHAGLVFTVDPDAGTLQAEGHQVPVLLCVPVTRDEARAVREWSPAGLVEVLARVDPLLISDLERPSLLQSPRARVLIDQRMEREGSSLSTMTAAVSEVSKSGADLTWKLSVDAVDTLVALLKGRIGHLRPFTVSADGARVELLSADAPSVALEGKTLTLKLSLVAARQLRSQLRAKPGTYTFELLPNFALVVC